MLAAEMDIKKAGRHVEQRPAGGERDLYIRYEKISSQAFVWVSGRERLPILPENAICLYCVCIFYPPGLWILMLVRGFFHDKVCHYESKKPVWLFVKGRRQSDE